MESLEMINGISGDHLGSFFPDGLMMAEGFKTNWCRRFQFPQLRSLAPSTCRSPRVPRIHSSLPSFISRNLFIMVRTLLLLAVLALGVSSAPVPENQQLGARDIYSFVRIHSLLLTHLPDAHLFPQGKPSTIDTKPVENSRAYKLNPNIKATPPNNHYVAKGVSYVSSPSYIPASSLFILFLLGPPRIR